MPDTGAKAKHGEPRPYHNGWAVKWLIEDQAAGRADLRFEGEDAVAPLAAWATYFWTDGDTPRPDGYRWTRDDVVADGVHLSESARVRVAGELLTFFAGDRFADVVRQVPRRDGPDDFGGGARVDRQWQGQEAEAPPPAREQSG